MRAACGAIVLAACLSCSEAGRSERVTRDAQGRFLYELTGAAEPEGRMATYTWGNAKPTAGVRFSGAQPEGMGGHVEIVIRDAERREVYRARQLRDGVAPPNTEAGTPGRWEIVLLFDGFQCEAFRMEVSPGE